MSNFSALKTTINANIKANNNQEITGRILNSILNQMVDALGGYQYSGIANPGMNPGTPDNNVFYVAVKPGVYTEFGGLTVSDGEVAILKYNGTWRKDTTDLATFAQLESLDQEVSGKDKTFVGATGSYTVRYRMFSGVTYIITNNASATASVRSFDESLTLTDDFNFYLGSGLSREVTPGQDIYGFSGYVGAESNFSVKRKDSILGDLSDMSDSLSTLEERVGILVDIYIESTSAVGAWGKTVVLKPNVSYTFKNRSEFTTSLILYNSSGGEIYRLNNLTSGMSVDITPAEEVAQVRGYSSTATVVDIQIMSKDSVFAMIQDIYAEIDELQNEIGTSIRIVRNSTSAVGSWQQAFSLKKGETYLFKSLCDDNTSLILYDADGGEVYRNNNFTSGASLEITPQEDVVSVRGYSSRSKIIDITIVQRGSLRDEIVTLSSNEDILLCNPPAIYDTLVLNNKRGKTESPGSILSTFSFLHFSDIHGSTENLERVKKFYDRYRKYIDDIYCSGDIVTNTYADVNILDESPNILALIGNHDAWSASEISGVTERADGPYWVVNQKATYDKFFGNVASWGVVQPANAAENGLCYYYKDYVVSGSKLRMICLDCMHYNVGGDLVDGQSVQNAWLESVLANALSQSIPVVIMVHYWPVYVNIGNPEVLRCPYTTTDYIASDYLPSIAIASVQSFIDQGGEFICWVCGHAHADVIAVPRDYPRQMFIAIDCSTTVNSVGNSARIVGTKSQDAFNIIAFDTTTKLVKVVRVGSDVTRQLKSKRTLLYRYAQYTDPNGEEHNPGLE